MVQAPYDEIATWYEEQFLVHQRQWSEGSDYADRIGIDQAIAELLGPGHGACLEVGCGTGIYADRVRSLGWSPIGIDLSGGMLGYAAGRLPVVQGDATRLP
ncbi:MAG: methyltransferase domain-containing protein, partial [Actinomycetota bacterium]